MFIYFRNAYQWGVGFDELKMLYALEDGYKVGLGLNGKGGWEVVGHGTKVGANFLGVRSVALFVGNKATAVIVKAKLDKGYFGKLNYDLTLQVILLLFRTLILIGA